MVRVAGDPGRRLRAPTQAARPIPCWPPIAEWPVIHLLAVDAHYHGGANCGFWETQIVAGGRLYAFASSNDVPLDVYKAVMSTVTLDPAAADDTPVGSPAPLGSPNPAASPG